MPQQAVIRFWISPKGGGPDHEHGGIVDEDVRHQEGADGQFGCSEAGLHGVGFGNARPGVGRQGDRRSDVGDDSEIEDKHVGRQWVNAKQNETGGGDGGGDDVVGRGGYSHPQNDGSDHAEEEGRQEIAMGQLDEAVRHFQAQAREGHHADDDAGRGTGDGHPKGITGSQLESVQDVADAHPGRSPEVGRQDADDKTHQGSVERRVAGQQETDDGKKRQEEIAAFYHHTAEPGQFIATHPPQFAAPGFVVHFDKDPEKIEAGGNGRGFGNIEIGNVEKLGHDERSRSHDGRHDLAAGGSRGFHRRGKFGSIAQALHHGNGEGAGLHGIGHRTSGDHPLQALVITATLAGPPEAHPAMALEISIKSCPRPDFSLKEPNRMNK